MIEDMFQIKIAVEGMKAEIIKVFDSVKISKAIEEASHKAVKEFDNELEEIIDEKIKKALKEG